MKLKDLYENKNWSDVKSLERALGDALLYEFNGEELPEDFDVLTGKNRAKVLDLARSFRSFSGASKIELLGKPSTAGQPTYGSGIEPKADLSVKASGKVFNVSVKSNDAYIFSAGTKDEYVGLVMATLELFERFYPEKAAKAVEEIKTELLKLVTFIGRSHKFSGYTEKQLKSKTDGTWFGADRYEKLKPSTSTRAKELEPEARNIIAIDNANKAGDYKVKLRSTEEAIRKVLSTVFSTNDDFARCFFWEVLTGAYKFGGLDKIAKFRTAAPWANVIGHIGRGWINVSSVEAQYVAHVAKNHYVRLQNVPRGKLATFQSFYSKTGIATAQELADCLREIDLTLKIVPKKGFVIKEFYQTQIEERLEAVLDKVTSLTELLLALEVFPKVSP